MIYLPLLSSIRRSFDGSFRPLRRALRFGATVWAVTAASFLSAEVSIGVDGFTLFTPSSDSRVVYVSESDGDDSNDGLSPSTAKKTILGGDALIRDGYPDHLLLKRGDTFPHPDLGRWKNGRSATEPLVFGAYGDDPARPLVQVTGRMIDWNGRAKNHLAVVGIDFYRAISDPNSSSFDDSDTSSVLRFVNNDGTASNIWVEDCRFRFCSVLPQGASGYFIQNFSFRRNIVTYNWAHGSTYSQDGGVQGMYMSSVENYVIEENLFHHNGWSAHAEDTLANQFNHNVYIQNTCKGDQLVRGNIFSYGSAQGLQLRSGGTAEMNAFIGNSVGMNIGYSPGPIHYTGDTIVANNVFTDGRPQIPNDSSNPQSGAIWGIWKQIVENTTVDDNIVANVKDTRGANVRPYNAMSPNQFGTGNIAWNWTQENFPATDPGWTDPARDADAYAQSLSYADWDEFIAAAIERPGGQAPYDVSAYGYVNFVRAGFDKDEVTPPYILSGNCEGIDVESIDIEEDSVTLNLAGDNQLLTAAISPINACDREVVWESSDDDVVVVDSNGLVTAVGQGTADVTVTTNDGGFTDSVSITVTGAIAVTSVEIEQGDFAVTVGTYTLLTAEVLPEDATDPTITWTSSDASIASIGEGGELAALKTGVVTITATDAEEAVSDTIEVTIEAPDGVQILADGGFGPGTGILSDIDGTALTLSSEVLDTWWARLGDESQSSSIVDGDGNPFLNAGSGITNGTVQAVAWPGEGDLHVSLIARANSSFSPEVSLFGANDGDTVNKFDNSSTLTLIDTESLSRAVSWTSSSFTTELTGSYDYLVVRLRYGAFDNVLAIHSADSELWAGYLVSEGWAFAEENFLGWVYVGDAPWVYSLALENWIFVPHTSLTTVSGAWVYFSDLGTVDSEESAPWIISTELNAWVYAPSFSSKGADAGQWGYVLKGSSSSD